MISVGYLFELDFAQLKDRMSYPVTHKHIPAPSSLDIKLERFGKNIKRNIGELKNRAENSISLRSKFGVNRL